MARPSNESKAGEIKIKEECDQIGAILNKLEGICGNPGDVQKLELSGTIGLLVGKLMVRYNNLVSLIGVYDKENN